MESRKLGSPSRLRNLVKYTLFMASRARGGLGSMVLKLFRILWVRSMSSGSSCLDLFPVASLQMTLLVAVMNIP